MKTLIIYCSVHHSNTKKIAKTMADILDADLLKPQEIKIDKLADYNLIGFGSGIYFGKHHDDLFDFVSKLPMQNNKKAFIFSTRGIMPVNICHKLLKKQLSEKEFDVINEFSSKGFDTVGPFKLIGGINKNRPNDDDLENAKKFAENINNELVKK
ncbi:MAG: flavodoxin family protein [Candidatus Aenigmarchaeota archaeon]|nr:flavodoxin family protein [Candidatus Aenigmarchaeota archaeon]